MAQNDYFDEKIRLRPSSEKMFFASQLAKNPGNFFVFGHTKISSGVKKNNGQKSTFFSQNYVLPVKS